LTNAPLRSTCWATTKNPFRAAGDITVRAWTYLRFNILHKSHTSSRTIPWRKITQRMVWERQVTKRTPTLVYDTSTDRRTTQKSNPH
jgi:hypothetical protein